MWKFLKDFYEAQWLRYYFAMNPTALLPLALHTALPPPPTITRKKLIGYDRIIFVSEEGAAAVMYVKTTELKEYVL